MDASVCFFFLLVLLGNACSAAAAGGCNCEEEDYGGIMETQRVSDMMIAVAYFSIPVELLCFVSCSDVPFKWVLFEFMAFIVLCGMTHLLTCYQPQPSFQLMLALTVFKFLTALVSFATAITLLTLIPLLLKVKVREFMLRKKTRDLGREMGVIKKQKDAALHVGVLTQEIRNSLDRHTILYTTLDKLSETLDLHNCAIWMPDSAKTIMNLTHQRKQGEISSTAAAAAVNDFVIPIQDSDVQEIKRSETVKLLDQESALARLSSGGQSDGAVAAIRVPMLRVSDYAILVLVLPAAGGRSWTNSELELVKVVADQVAVALSHAAVLEESQLMRDKLAEQNRALQQAKQEAVKASQARSLFQSKSLRRPMHSILGLLSIMQDDHENLSNQQRVVVEAAVKTSNAISMLIDDSSKDRFLLEMRSIRLHSLIKETAHLAKCLCSSRGYRFIVEADKSLPDNVMGDDRRVFQVILYMMGSLLNRGKGGSGAILTLKISFDTGRWATWKSNSSDGGYVNVKFEIGINDPLDGDDRINGASVEQSLSFGVCRKLVELMQGKIWVVPYPVGFNQSMALVLRFQLRTSTVMVGMLETGESSSEIGIGMSNSVFRGLQVLLAEEDEVNRAVTRKLLEKLGCIVSTVTTGSDCIMAVNHSYQMVILDAEMSDVDGFEVASRIRASRSRSWPLIVALTAVSDDDVWERCLQIGINGVIQKPVLLKGISNELRRVLIRTNNLH